MTSYNLANVFLIQNRLENALDVIKRSLKLNPSVQEAIKLHQEILDKKKEEN